MARKRIKFKEKIRSLTLYDSLWCALVWGVDPEEVNINWTDKTLIRKLWRLHGKLIMTAWEQDPSNAGDRPKIWWHIFTKKEDFKILRHEKHRNVNGEPEPVEIWPSGQIEYQYPIFEGKTAVLKKLNFLEAWEISELDDKKGKSHFEKETDCLPY